MSRVTIGTLAMIPLKLRISGRLWARLRPCVNREFDAAIVSPVASGAGREWQRFNGLLGKWPDSGPSAWVGYLTEKGYNPPNR